jgi:hypothetical protein
LNLTAADAPLLRRLDRKARRRAFRQSGLLSPVPREPRAKRVPHDREKPRFHPRARLELVDVGDALGQRLLDQIVGIDGVAIKGTGKGPKGGDQLDNFIIVTPTWRLRARDRQLSVSYAFRIETEN